MFRILAHDADNDLLLKIHQTYEAAMEHCDDLRLAYTRGRIYGWSEMTSSHIS